MSKGQHQIGVKIETALLEKLQGEAGRGERTVSQLVRKILRGHFDRRGEVAA